MNAKQLTLIDLTDTQSPQTRSPRTRRLLAQLRSLHEALNTELEYSNATERPQITSPSDAADLLQPFMAPLEQEEVWTLLLDTRNRVIQLCTVYRGSLNTSSIRIGELYREAIRQNAASIVVAHNHPSSDCSPSPQDIAITKMIKEAGQLLDIPLIDHLIIGKGRYVSLKERGLGF